MSRRPSRRSLKARYHRRAAHRSGGVIRHHHGCAGAGGDEPMSSDSSAAYRADSDAGAAAGCPKAGGGAGVAGDEWQHNLAIRADWLVNRSATLQRWRMNALAAAVPNHQYRRRIRRRARYIEQAQQIQNGYCGRHAWRKTSILHQSTIAPYQWLRADLGTAPPPHGTKP